MKNERDTIVAEATPRGRGGIGVVRISGPNTTCIAQRILKKTPAIRTAEYASFWDADGLCLDEGIALFFKAPHSFTGEDVLELQGHGSPVVMSALVQAALNAGARLAEPGEFSLRAFLNDKIDLLQAEAVADLINAHSLQAARGALRSLQGHFSGVINQFTAELIQLRMYVEAAIDFPEEEIDFLSSGTIEPKLNHILQQLEAVIAKAHQGLLLLNGVRVAIIGRPNAGKSSLLNLLAGYDRAIVTDYPGTTRDVLHESIDLEGLTIRLVDTAGLRVEAQTIEQEGIQRALQEVPLADHLIIVVDRTQTQEADPEQLLPEWFNRFPAGVSISVLYNKIDKLSLTAKSEIKKGHALFYVSIKTGEGMDTFKNHLKNIAGFSNTDEGSDFIARRRHLEALEKARTCLLEGRRQLLLFKAGELLAEELRQAQLALDEITGKFTADDLLGKIFSEFCIGK